MDKYWLSEGKHADPKEGRCAMVLTQFLKSIDARCGCKRCVERTSDTYRMVGKCRNCGAKDIVILYRAGDDAANQDCPVCGNWRSVHADRLATSDETPVGGF